MNRRSFAASAGLAALAFGTGCVDTLRDAFGRPPRLGWLAVSNYSHEPQRFQIQIERAGETIHDSTHRVEGYPETRQGEVATIPDDVVDCTWEDARGPFTLRGRVGDAEWVERPIDEDRSSDEGTADCVVADAEYGRIHSENVVFSVSPRCREVPTYEGGCSFANSDS
ncbi:hypothetical protein [Halomicrococcus sp. NG-SE-24]|uniref:hypothetical protein n=1 Tax=Halomicrococcus sp. NG-SE-24 TaxID=3436928 RepID=UPI003D98075D